MKNNKLTWMKKKPKLTHECLLMVATEMYDDKLVYEYTLFQILKTNFDDSWYYGIYTQEGDEWGGYEDLKADMYCFISFIRPIKN